MAINIPSTLKATALKKIAFKCGISISGTKPILIQRLQDELPYIILSPGTTSASTTADSQSLRILSIDMGIRNFSYCLLEIPSSNSTLKSKKIRKVSSGALNLKSPQKKPKSTIPILQSWQKLSLLSQSPSPSQSPDSESEAALKDKEKIRNEFTPAILSSAAYKLLRHTLLPLSPTHILIERQRFRSMGSKHILEWTIRVNMLESMLWATLKTLSEEKVWAGQVIEIAPRKVGSFWVEESGLLGEEDATFKKVRTTKEAKARNKGAKIDLVRKWLEDQPDRETSHDEMVLIGSQQVQKVKERYTAKWDRKVGRAKGYKVKSKSSSAPKTESEGEKKETKEMANAKEEEVGKLDDLADCLLQGMAWLKWQENRKRALEEGVEVLLD
ncbi:hypothetical protein MFRU_016g00190 [Monilinia fructicola]|uniref:SAP domain-containing protein n=1 Tax=Monilinia fructicola TaxID=38448 RepID=A0A5M9JPV2_MONFR|nr:hypothetical protein EYC84_001524 [Monilinia fructicola]KAG4029261.1 hypothetical protein MFRU_016g00190 [Monilinia fructicola]